MDSLLWKECCKYVHATAWLVNGYERRMKDEYVRRMIIAFGLHYAASRHEDIDSIAIRALNLSIQEPSVNTRLQWTIPKSSAA